MAELEAVLEAARVVKAEAEYLEEAKTAVETMEAEEMAAAVEAVMVAVEEMVAETVARAARPAAQAR